MFLIISCTNDQGDLSPDGKWIVYNALVEGTENNIDIFAVLIEKPSNRIKLVGTDKREAEGIWNPIE